MRRLWVVAGLGISGMAMSNTALAGTDFSFDQTCSSDCQQAFEGIVDDIGAALNYKPLAPAEATGITGIGAGAFVNYTGVENKADWKKLTGTNVDAIGMAGITLSKGLPFGLDVGAFYTAIPDTSAKAYGAEVRYAILEGGIAEPALAVRGAYTTTSGIDDFDYAAYSLDASLSKGFTIVTPYVGGGFVWARATPKGAIAQAPANLQKTESNRTRFYAGLRLSLVVLELTPEYERQGANDSYSLRVGFSF